MKNPLEDNGTSFVSAYDLPFSEFLDDETRGVLAQERREREALDRRYPICNYQDVLAAEVYYEKHYYPALIAQHRARYPVSIQPQTMAGINTEIFAPQEGLSTRNQTRVLINVHGGAFLTGRRRLGQVESIPIAAVGKFKVVSIDYRMGPEHRFPAASEDVAAVYRELLKTYPSQNIGIYGSSAGGVLTAQAVAWFQEEGLPRPGAAGMFGAAASYWGTGDSGHFFAALSGFSLSQTTTPQENPYFEAVDSTDSLAFPIHSAARMAKFPPSLLLTSTRDLALSSVVHTHGCLVEQGVQADLHVWEGLEHAFHYSPELPQSRRLYAIAAKFFDDHLER
jgi:epsilon-lactone hydrolase